MWRSFSRSQVAAFLGTIIDYAVLTTWVEVFHLHYAFGVAIGSALGAIINFLFNRHWSFESNEVAWHIQAKRYAMVACGSLVLNTLGVYLITEYAKIYYLISQVIVSISVGFFYNYPLHRFFVYKKKEIIHEINIHLATAQSEN